MRLKRLASTAVLVLAALLGGLSNTAAWAGDRNTLLPPGESRYRPTRMPDRIVLMATEDPARTAVVAWRTDPSVRETRAQLAVALDTPGLHRTAMEVTGTAQTLVAGNGTAVHHRVEFSDLLPGTLYAYRVRGLDTWSEWFQFRTVPAEFKPFTFLYLGDAQNSIRSHFSRVIRQAWGDAPDAAFMLHAGDLVNLRSGDDDNEWGEWFEAGGFLYGAVPNVTVTGNHEYPESAGDDGVARRSLTPHWAVQFPSPRNGPPGFEDTVYFTRYPGLLVVVLDSTRASESDADAAAQAAWLEKVLSGNAEPWVVVSHHHPVLSVAMNRDNAVVRQQWEPLFVRFGVDLVLNGHDHLYGRGHETAREQGRAGTAPLPVYVTSVAGPKMYLAADRARQQLDRIGEDVQLYQVVHVAPDRLRFESRTATGRLYDAFDIVRKPDGHKKMVDRMPAGSPESRCTNPELPRPTRCWEGKELVD
jgi:hypothetical protein